MRSHFTQQRATLCGGRRFEAYPRRGQLYVGEESRRILVEMKEGRRADIKHPALSLGQAPDRAQAAQ
jgi:hypothetical protein